MPSVWRMRAPSRRPIRRSSRASSRAMSPPRRSCLEPFPHPFAATTTAIFEDIAEHEELPPWELGPLMAFDIGRFNAVTIGTGLTASAAPGMSPMICPRRPPHPVVRGHAHALGRPQRIRHQDRSAQ